MKIKSFQKYFESKGYIINRYFLVKSSLPLYDIENYFLRFKEIFQTSLRIKSINSDKVEGYNYFIEIKNFDLSDPEQINEIRVVNKYMILKFLEDWFKEEFLDKFEVKKDKRYPNFDFYCIGNSIYMQLERKKLQLYCSYSKIWSIFDSVFSLKYVDIQMFIKDVVEEHYGLKGVTPSRLRFISQNKWLNNIN